MFKSIDCWGRNIPAALGRDYGSDALAHFTSIPGIKKDMKQERYLNQSVCFNYFRMNSPGSKMWIYNIIFEARYIYIFQRL